ncbi:MAG: 3-oxoacyl-ACP reductase FabG [Mogibacterium sp.]|nr:3-oxoacyl-ACP reductase FabG [Mogibacterium sp.]
MANILITGGSRGIGAEAVRQFTAAGHKVVFTFHKSEIAADILRQETGATPVRCDVKHHDSVRIAVDKAVSVLGQIDILICNAAIADYGLITDMDISRWEDVINTDLSGVFYCVRYVLPAMISRRNGCIITVGSMLGEVGASCEAAYSAAKAGVIGLTKALAKEVGPSGIRVNCISPGMIDTGMNASVSEYAADILVDKTPLCRSGAPEDIAKVMMFLASEDAAFITGQVISVNGGLVI